MSGGYDDGYKACSCFWGRQAGSLIGRLESIVPSLDGLAVLDVGCGEGKNAAYLAARGAIVTAIDVSPLAIRNALAAWPQSSRLRFEVADVAAISLEDQRYDIVVAYGLMHCLRDLGTVGATIERLQAATKSLGYHVVCAFNSRHQELQAHPNFVPILVPHGWYLSCYRSWTVLHETDADLCEAHPHNNIQHTHSLTRLIAKRQ